MEQIVLFKAETYQFRTVLMKTLMQSGCDKEIRHNLNNIVRLHRDLNVADYTVPDKCLSINNHERSNFSKSQLDDRNRETLSGIIQSIPTASAAWSLKVSTVTLDPKNGILLKLDRVHTFKKVVTKYTSEGIKSFFSRDVGPSVLIISSCGRKDKSKNPGLELRNQLRCKLVTHHLRAVCEMLGIEVDHLTMSDEVSSTVAHITGDDVDSPEVQVSEQQLDERKYQKQRTLDRFVSEIKSTDSSTRPDISGEKRDEEHKVPGASIINLRDVLERYQLPVGNKGYMPNLGEVKVLSESGDPTRLLRDCVKLEMMSDSLRRTLDHMTSGQVAVHVSSPSQSYHQQCVNLLWRTVSTSCQGYRHIHAVVGAVMVTGCSNTSNMQESLGPLYDCYEYELRQASAVKYGDEIQELNEEKQRRSTLAKAAIKFDIMTSALGSVVRLDMSPKDQSTESRPGVFVLYNYARLSALFKKFDQQVTQGVYPSLPPVGEVQFETLLDQAEWKLLFVYVLQFPDIVRETLGNVLTVDGPACSLYPNKVCRFLQALSRDLSVYYSRTHILGEPRPHLLPTMFARLYLLKSVMLVMRDGLHLLDIQALTQM